MNATTRVEPVYPFAAPQPSVLRVVLAPVATLDLAIDAQIAARWCALDDAMRARVAAFLAYADCDMSSVLVDGTLPQDFARDLRVGGRTLREAFPGLVRRVTYVGRQGHQIRVRVACAGEHRAPFFRLFSATGRRVAFDVVHRLVVRDGNVVEHHVTLDVRALIVQLATAPKRAAL